MKRQRFCRDCGQPLTSHKPGCRTWAYATVIADIESDIARLKKRLHRMLLARDKGRKP